MAKYYMSGSLASTTPLLEFGIKGHDLAQGIEAMMDGVGDLHNTVAATLSVSPAITVSSCDLAVVSSLMGQDPIKMVAAELTLLLWDEATAILATGSVHKQYAAALAMLFPQTLSWQQGQAAEFEAILQCISADGSTAPVVESSVANPSVDGIGELWTLNSVTIGGTLISNVTSVNVNFGLQPTSLIDGGDVVPSVALASTRDPSISITSQDAAAITLAAEAGALSLQFIEMTPTGRGTKTVTVTAAATHIVPQNTSGQVRSQGNQTIEVKPYAEPGAALFAVAYDDGA